VVRDANGFAMVDDHGSPSGSFETSTHARARTPAGLNGSPTQNCVALTLRARPRAGRSSAWLVGQMVGHTSMPGQQIEYKSIIYCQSLAVLAVCCEPVSRSISLLTGKITGILSILIDLLSCVVQSRGDSRYLHRNSLDT